MRGVSRNKFWTDYMQVWESGQTKLPEVVRWKKYRKKGERRKVRRQNSLQHSYSITILGSIVCHVLRPHVLLKESFLKDAWMIHDHGEGEICSDTHYIDKSDERDLKEYEAFVKCYSVLFSKELFEDFHKAFLLQFALKNPPNFPEEARLIMMELTTMNAMECRVFEVVERLDYVFYAMEQYIKRNNAKILVQVMRNQMDHLNRLAKDLPGFGETIWHESARVWFQDFLVIHNGYWIEKKGE